MRLFDSVHLFSFSKRICYNDTTIFQERRREHSMRTMSLIEKSGTAVN